MMRMTRWFRAAAAACFLFAAGAHAQGTTGAAPTVTATCKDGTSFSGTSKRGACSGHGGVKAWDKAAATPAAATAPVPATAPASTKAPAAMAKPGGGPGQVWVNTDSKVYHCQGSRWYGKTKQGEYMSEQQAKAGGFRPANKHACS